jgi:hypothetical protein
MDDWQALTLRATVVLLVTSVVLIGSGLAGIGASVGLTLVLVAFGMGLAAVRPQLVTLPTVLEHDLGEYGQDLWLGPLLGALALVAVPDASPAELQTLGGLAGLVGMVNYFLRPVYVLVYALALRARRALA